jgi:pyruvate dehydrogenase E1 component
MAAKPKQSPSSIVMDRKSTEPLKKGGPDTELLERIAKRALYYSTQMIHLANNREDVQKGDPKVGGHPAACASLTHILAALHLLVRQPQDHIAVKPHGSPMDHAYSHLMGLFYHPDGSKFTDDEAKAVMRNLRKFTNPEDPHHEAVFQSYHAVWDPDHHNYFPSGTVGIPPVMAAYMALAYRFANDHGFEVPQDPHFWAIMGDSEFREGSLHECMPDVPERHLGNVTWIVDYNRQNLDGARIKSEEMTGTDADRIDRLGRANGWIVHNVRHGRKRLAFFQQTGGELLRKVLEKHLTDYEFQTILMSHSGKAARSRFIELEPGLERPLSALSDEQVLELVEDVGGHDIQVMADVLEQCRRSEKPTLVIAHTIKGWHLACQAAQGNHSALPEQSEVDAIREREGIPADDLFQRLPLNSREGAFLEARGHYMHQGIEAQRQMKARNGERSKNDIENTGGFPDSFNIDLKLVPWGNTQWMWGQIAAKLIRIANAGTKHETDGEKKQPLSENDKLWKPAADFVVTMAPDVGTSTNLNPSMDGKIYGPEIQDFEDRYHVKDTRRPDLVPLERQQHRHLRFEIEEGNAMSCAGSFGKMKDITGVPVLPLMSIYDFFIKRAHDQFFYNIYWRSGFICVGTPSGVSLSPEGAQHGWKSDFQIPNLVTWEPAFIQELDWIFADSVKRHMTGDNLGRQSVLLRLVTMSIDQKMFLECLQTQKRFEGREKAEILADTRLDVLAGGYWLLNYEGFEGYAPGDNVVHLFAMGTLVPQAVEASRKLLEQGIYANVCVVTSPDLLLGNQAQENGYSHLRGKLGINGNLHLNANRTVSTQAELLSLRGSRIPLVSTHDGEPGLLDNIGSIVGAPQEALCVRKHSKCGRPTDVFAYHHMDAASVMEAVHRMMEQAAAEEILIDPRLLSSG